MENSRQGAPEHIDASQPNTNVRDLVDQKGSLSMDDFIDAMTIEDPKIELGETVEGKQRPKLVVNIPNFKKRIYYFLLVFI